MRLHGKLALLGGLDILAPTILILLFYTYSIVSASPPGRASPLDCVYMGNFGIPENRDPGRKGGTQRWDAKVGRKGGTQRWDTEVGRRGGTQRWDAKVGRKGGMQRWDAEVGRRGGTQRWDAKVGRKR